MAKFQVIGIMAVLLLFHDLGFTVQLQDESRQVIDPKAIFAESIEIIETLPVLTFNNLDKYLLHFNPDEMRWNIYEYPDDATDFRGYYRLTNGNYLVGSQLLVSKNILFYSTLRYFDIVSGQFSQPHLSCGWVNNQDDFNLYINLDSSLIYFCDPITNETIMPLNQAVQSKMCPTYYIESRFLWHLPLLTSDEAWLIFEDCYYKYNIYAYQIATQSLNYLGRIEPADYLDISYWSESRFISIQTGTYGPEFLNLVYTADLSKYNSLGRIAQQYGNAPRFYDDPPRIIWDGNLTLARESVENGYQRIYEYNFETREHRTLVDMPCNRSSGLQSQESICRPSYAVPNQFNLLAIVSGETQNNFTLITIIDTQNNDVVYSGLGGDSAELFWLDEHSLMFTGVSSGQNSRNHIVTIRESNYEETFFERQYDYILTVSPKGDYLLTGRFEDRIYGVLRFSDMKFIPILRPYDISQYHFSIKWNQDNSLDVYMEDDTGYDKLGAWRVHIPTES
jgi:hypothetical protein